MREAAENRFEALQPALLELQGCELAVSAQGGDGREKELGIHRG